MTYDASEWKPGDVASGRLGDYEGRFIYRGEGAGWDEVDGSDGGWDGGYIKDLRPLVVIDPDDRAAVERLRDLWDDAMADQNGTVVNPEWVGRRGSALQAALREFARPTPRIEEPTGRYAAIEDASGSEWVRLGDGPAPWMHNGPPANRGTLAWSHLDPVRILSPGVTP